MERILDMYEKKYDPRRPVVCFDERPCQLLDDAVMPMTMKAGRIKKEDYEYQRKGTCSVLMAYEPLQGQRIIEVRVQRRKVDYAEFMDTLAFEHYASADKIFLIQDNLNTHTPGSFYERFGAKKAFNLSKRFEMIYTPKKASWLNMVEIELSVLSRQCLQRRIGDMKRFRREVLAWAEDRNEKEIRVNWQFTKNAAREKLNSFYENIKN